MLERHRTPTPPTPRGLPLPRRIPHGDIKRREGSEWKGVKDTGVEQEPLRRGRYRGPEVQEESTDTNVYAHAPWAAPSHVRTVRKPYTPPVVLQIGFLEFSSSSPPRSLGHEGQSQAPSSCFLTTKSPFRPTLPGGHEEPGLWGTLSGRDQATSRQQKGPREGRGTWGDHSSLPGHMA